MGERRKRTGVKRPFNRVICFLFVFCRTKGREKEGQEVRPRARDLDDAVCGGGAVTMHVSPLGRRLRQIGNRQGAKGGRRVSPIKKGAPSIRKSLPIYWTKAGHLVNILMCLGCKFTGQHP